jgi:hypothetical protein
MAHKGNIGRARILAKGGEKRFSLTFKKRTLPSLLSKRIIAQGKIP